MRKARTIETCPTCKVEFIVAAIHTSGRTPYKVCPEGHETPVHHLAKSRQRAIVIAPQPVVPKEESIFLRAREVGVVGQKNAERMALAAMVGCYETLKRTTPALSHGVIDGVFARTVKVSREILA
jgi:hypothetical protein